MAAWSSSVRTGSDMRSSRLVMTAEQGDLVEVLLTELRVRDAEPLLRSQAQHTRLPLAAFPVHLRRRLTRLVERVYDRQRRVDLALPHEPVGVPCLAVVREVAALEGLEHHPEVPVVVFDRVPGRRRARDDHPAPLADEHRGAHRLTARGLEPDGGISARELTDLLAEAAPLARILGVLVLPELVPLGLAVDHVLDAHLVEQRRPLRRRHHTDGCTASVHDVLRRVRADAAARAPDEHALALRHLGAVGADDYPVAGRVAQRVAGRLLPWEGGGLRQ